MKASKWRLITIGSLGAVFAICCIICYAAQKGDNATSTSVAGPAGLQPGALDEQAAAERLSRGDTVHHPERNIRQVPGADFIQIEGDDRLEGGPPATLECAIELLASRTSGSTSGLLGYRIKKAGERDFRKIRDLTDGEGTMAMLRASALKPGSYELLDWMTGASLDFKIDNDCASPTHVNFAEIPLSRITVHVFQSDGSPFSGSVSVRLLHRNYGWQQHARKVDSGLYEAHVASGDYDVTAINTDLQRASLTIDASGAAVGIVLDITSESLYRVKVKFAKDGDSRDMPRSWCDEVLVHSADGREIQSSVSNNLADQEFLDLGELLSGDYLVSSIEVRVGEPGRLYISFPAIEGVGSAEDLLVDFSQSSNPTYTLAVE